MALIIANKIRNKRPLTPTIEWLHLSLVDDGKCSPKAVTFGFFSESV